MTGVITAVRSFLTDAQGSGHLLVDFTRFAAVGHSFGAALAVQYATIAADLGLPVPMALMPTSDCGGCSLGDTTTISETTRLLVVMGDKDGQTGPREIWAALPQIPADRKDFVEIRSDLEGSPILWADHSMPATAIFGGVDSLDWYGTWKLLDALLACSFDGTWCEFAFGNTPEQRFMGVWSNGVPVVEMKVTDDPGPP